MRAIRTAAAAASVAALALGAAGCGGDGGDDAERASRAVAGLYAIDHGGAEPTGNSLAPYTEAFRRVQQGCEGSAEELASGILNVASDASNGSGRTITNLEALRAVARSVDTTKQDCGGVFVGVEARLEGRTPAG